MTKERLIDANALIEFARNQVDHKADINDIARFPTSSLPSGWIPCSERLPEEEDEYDVTVRVVIDGIEQLLSTTAVYDPYDDEDVWLQHNYLDGVVLAWQPLPAPWSGEEE